MAVKKKILLVPARLNQGDTIGIVAPAGPFDPDKFYRGLEVLESMGFRTFVSDDLFLTKGYLAGPDPHRAKLVNRFFADKEIKAIVCARGGFGSLRILSLLDYGMIRGNPKIFMGFSDISALLSALYQKCGLVTFHGPVVTTLGDASQKTRNDMFLAFTSERSLEIVPTKGVTIKPGKASGPVSGGNLTTLCHLVGTPFEPNYNEHLLLLEDKGETSYRIDRMLTQMKMAGCLKGIAGLILGSFEECGPIDEIFRIVNNIFKDDSIPILAGFDAGHGNTNSTIPMGLEATLDADKHLLSFHASATI